MYNLKDISIIIPTYNRPKDLKITLRSFRPFLKKIMEVVIIDQSKDDKTKELIKKIKSKKIRYFHSDIASLTKARNKGAEKMSKDSKLACFIDDDVTLTEDYFSGILKVFNDYPEALGVGAYNHEEVREGNMTRMIKKLFFIGIRENQKADVRSVYGNNYPIKLDRVINSQWIPGVNMCFKKEVLRKYKFDENITWLAEDFDFTYRVYQGNVKGLFITPFSRITHRISNVERYPTKKMAYVNQINHFYLNFKNFDKGFKERSIFIWCLSGIILLRILNAVFNFKKTEWLKLGYFISSFWYCLRNMKRIKRGDLEWS